MTKARLGSQSPKTSRNPITFAGLTICEARRPNPNNRPEANAARIAGIGSGPKPMTQERAGHDGDADKNEGRCDRARREARQSANTVPACAAAAQPRAETDQ